MTKLEIRDGRKRISKISQNQPLSESRELCSSCHTSEVRSVPEIVRIGVVCTGLSTDF